MRVKSERNGKGLNSDGNKHMGHQQVRVALTDAGGEVYNKQAPATDLSVWKR